MKYLLALVKLLLLMGTASLATPLPKLNSYPSAVAVIFLDFDGHTVTNTVWDNGKTIESLPSSLSDAQVDQVFHRVAEDFRPFNLNITTDSSIFLSAPLNKRMRVIITPTNYWRLGAGGVAWVSSFTSGDDTPCFVFCNSTGTYQPKGIAEAISHETGHTLGLLHQSVYDKNCALVNAYHPGSGSGETSWAPIMGNSNTKNLSLWNYGPTQSGCHLNQDNLYFITTLNGIGYRQDDHSDDIGSATPVYFNVQQFNTTGIISTIFDRDIFRFDLNEKGRLVLHANPFSVGAGNEGANLDIKLSLLNSSGNVIAMFNPEQVLHAGLDTILQEGTYYVSVDGTGNLNTNNDYGSLGSYDISGYFEITAILLPIKSVKLTGYKDKKSHSLSWIIETNVQIREAGIEVSVDGYSFELLHVAVGGTNHFTYVPSKSGSHYYRIRVASESGEVKYSNILKLVQEAEAKSRYVIRSIMSNELLVLAANKFEYRLFDYAGALVRSGTGSAGTNHVNLAALPGGIYTVRLSAPEATETKRFFKQ